MSERTPSVDSLVGDLRARQLTRWQAGDRVPLEALLAGHPELLADPEVLLDLIYAELLLREEFGERPGVEEYVRRFPACEAGLRRQLAFHDALAALDTDAPADGTLPHAGPADAAAAVLGPYEVLGEVGRGGMGVVYKARHRTLTGRLAAVKVLRGAAEAEERARFLTEARAVAALEHPNIVRIYDIYDPPTGEPFLALEYADGGSLAGRIAGTPLPPHAAAALLVPLAEAVQHAHQRGILHRDLKPANVLLRRKSQISNDKSQTTPNSQPSTPGSGTPSPIGISGLGFGCDLSFEICDFEVKVTDFGLAKRLDADSARTRTGVILGTPSYMAPEQAAGRRVGPAADVYGLGAILYECLTGRPPFQADTVLNTLNQAIEQEPVPPRALQPGVPRDLETICLKCLHKQPDRRYASAAELGDDLRRFLAGEPIRARPAGALERAGRWVRRRPAAAVAVGLGGLAVAALVALWAGFTLRLEEQKREAVREWHRAERERAEAQRQSRRARHLLGLTATAVDEIAVTARASKEAEARSGNAGAVVFKLACYYARAARSLRDDAELAAADREHLAEQYAVSAVRLLNCARHLGFFQPDRPENRRALRAEADLEVLRSREDYRRLLAGLP